MLFALVFAAGTAALSWEVLWQLQASLAVGVSATGTAITLATVMGGMTVGSLGAGRLLRTAAPQRPHRVYAALEAVIGVSGLAVLPGFAALGRLDAAVWAVSPALAPLVHLVGIVLLLGVPTVAMGATLPVLGLLARRHGTSLSVLYGLNLVGACVGTLAMAFVLLPLLGVARSVALTVAVDLLAALGAALLPPGRDDLPAEGTAPQPVPTAPLSTPAAWAAVFTSGFAVFTLEVVWFRALRAVFLSTTDSFAILLAAVLLPLGLAAHLVPRLRAEGHRLGPVLGVAGVLVLLVTPVVERMDHLVLRGGDYYLLALPSWFVQSTLVMGGPILVLGVTVPWVLDEQRGPARWAAAYGVNTAGAIAGSIGAAWGLLPTLGVVRSSWAVGIGVVAVGLALASDRRTRVRLALAGAVGLAVAASLDTGIGRERALGNVGEGPYTVLEHREGPDVTTAVVAFPDGYRALLIDGFRASGEHGGVVAGHSTSYMAWMGHLPMMLSAEPRTALVICFGTGQTADAVRSEGPERLDIVDINPAVLQMGHLFPTNRAVLSDARVHPHVMDGRAWLRRVDRQYDVITLEPMPPFFAGVNALYAREFYELARDRLAPGGTVAQWLPFHLVTELHGRAIAATFLEVFPNSLLWLDPVGKTGILVGRKDDVPIDGVWPGADRAVARPDPGIALRDGVVLDAAGLRAYAADAPAVTDDNQLLAYSDKQDVFEDDGLVDRNLAAVERAGR